MTSNKGFVPESYDPVEYWNNRAQPNTDERPGISPKDIEFFKSQVPDGSSILEVGPGIGRLIPLYATARGKAFSTLDLTRQHEATVNEVAAENGLTAHQYFMSEADGKYPFEDGAFDVAVSSYVLIHVPFKLIRHTMRELARVADKVVVYVNLNPNAPDREEDQKPHHHVFRHDYRGLCEELGFKIHRFDSAPGAQPNVEVVKFCYSRV